MCRSADLPFFFIKNFKKSLILCCVTKREKQQLLNYKFKPNEKNST